MTIKIILIDDHTLFRSGIKALLSRQHGFEVIGEAADGLSGIKMISRLQPDVVLLDLDMPGMNGREALSQIISINPQQAVIMLTVSEDNDDLTECMRIGARGYLLKNINADFLLESIRKAAEGDNVFSPEMTAKLVKSLISPPTCPRDTGTLLTYPSRTGNLGLSRRRTQQQNHRPPPRSRRIHRQSPRSKPAPQTQPQQPGAGRRLRHPAQRPPTHAGIRRVQTAY